MMNGGYFLNSRTDLEDMKNTVMVLTFKKQKDVFDMVSSLSSTLKISSTY